MRFFDCNCRFGFEPIPPPSYSTTPEELIREMDFNGISQALAVHSESFCHRPTPRGVSCGRLLPVLNFLPFHNVEELGAGRLRKTLMEGRFRAARFQPRKGYYGFSGELFAAQFHTMEEIKLPLLLDLNQEKSEYLLDYDLTDRFLALFPRLPVILVNTSYHVDTVLYPLMERHDNLYIETSGYQGFRCIEGLASRFGTERILYGSRYPFFYPSASRCRVERAFLTDRQKEQIAHGNLDRLLEAIDYE